MRNKLKFTLVACIVAVMAVATLVIAIVAGGCTVVLLSDCISIPLVVCIIGILVYIAIALLGAYAFPKLAEKLVKKLGL